MIEIALTVVAASVAFVIGVWGGSRYGHAHVMDSGTDRYEIVPFGHFEDVLAVNRTTVYRCQASNCHAEETKKTCIKQVDREDIEAAIDECEAVKGRK